MKKMKKSKIIASAVLTACFMAFSVLASVNLKPVNVYGATNVSVSNYVQNVITKTGANATASFVTNEAQVGNADYKYSGVKLTGGSGAKFNLGTIDLRKSFWAGYDFTMFNTSQDKWAVEDSEINYELSESAVNNYDVPALSAGSNPKPAVYYNSGRLDGQEGDVFSSYIGFVFAPNTTDGEMQYMKITLTDTKDDNNYMVVDFDLTRGGIYTTRLQTMGKDNSQLFGMWKNNASSPGPSTGGAGTPSLDGKGSQNREYELCYSQNWNASSDGERNARLYTPYGHHHSQDAQGTWLLADYDKTNWLRGDNGQTYQSFGKWFGFDNPNVQVSVEFTTANAPTSIIVTKLGGFDLSKVQGGNLAVEDKDFSVTLDSRSVSSTKVNQAISVYAPIISNVFEPAGVVATNFTVDVKSLGKTIKTLTSSDFTNGKANYAFATDGVYVLEYNVAEQILKQEVEVISEQKLLVSDIINGFTTSQGASVVKGSKTLVGSGNTFGGLVLTGGEGATFDLDKVLDLRGVNWKGVNDYTSFVEFVIAPTGKNKFGGNFAADLNKLQFVLTDVEDADKQIVIEHRNFASGSDNNTTNYFSTVATKATGQDFKCYRYRDGSEYHFMYGQCPKTVSFAGYQTTPVALVYSENTTYSPNAYTVATSESYALRNYNSNVITEFGAPGQAMVEFSGKFKLSVIFESFSTKDSAGAYTNPDGSMPTETSIVLTSLAGYSLNSDEIVIDRNKDTVVASKVNDEVNLGVDGLKFPNVELANALLANLSYEAGYTLYKGETAVKTGSYTANGGISKEEVTTYGWGDYTLVYTDKYNRQITQKYFVKPMVTVATNAKADIYVNGVKVNAGDQIALADGDEIKVEAFKGYTANVKLGESDTNAQIYVFTKDSTFLGSTLSAEVTALEYSITFDIAESENFTGSKPSNITFNVENAGSVVLPTPEKEGAAFLGWFVGDKKITSLKDVELQDYSLVGYFGAPYVTITYVVDGVEKVENVIKGQTPSVYTPTKSGYEFNGWVDALVGGSPVDLTNLNKNVTLYATWEEVDGIGSSKLENFKPSANLEEKQNGLSVFDYIGIAVLVIGIAGFVVAMILKGRGKQS